MCMGGGAGRGGACVSVRLGLCACVRMLSRGVQFRFCKVLGVCVCVCVCIVY
jgi:hypothetical protein